MRKGSLMSTLEVVDLLILCKAFNNNVDAKNYIEKTLPMVREAHLSVLEAA